MRLASRTGCVVDTCTSCLVLGSDISSGRNILTPSLRVRRQTDRRTDRQKPTVVYAVEVVKQTDKQKGREKKVLAKELTE